MREFKIIVYGDEEEKIEYYKALSKSVAKRNKIDIRSRTYHSDKQLLFEMEDLIKMKLIDTIVIIGENFNLGIKIEEMGYNGSILFILPSSEYLTTFEHESFYYIHYGKEHLVCYEWGLMEALRYSKKLHDEYIIVSRGGEYKQIKVNEILYFQIRDHVVEVVYEQGTFEFISTLGKIENQMFGHGFVRIHRSFLVSMYAIKRMSFDAATMNNGDLLPVGRKYYGKLKAVMNDLGR